MVGRATNEDGKRLRFQAILIHGDKRNFAVAAFSALDIPRSVQAALDEVVGSFEQSPSLRFGGPNSSREGAEETKNAVSVFSQVARGNRGLTGRRVGATVGRL